MEKIKIKNKYILFKYDKNEDIVKKITDSKKISELKEKIIGKKIGEKYEILLMKLSKESKFNEKNINTPLGKLIGGPIKITFKMYLINDNNILKPLFEKTTNSKGELDTDRRNSQYLYITQEHYNKNGIKIEDLQKVALLAFKLKLERRPLAVKLIDQIYNIK
jgi:ribonuclease HII